MHRDEEALRFAELAQRCWRRADSGLLQVELQHMRGGPAATTGAAAPGSKGTGN
jgi:hypothetical protein